MPMTQDEIAELLLAKSQRTVGRPSADTEVFGQDIMYRHGFDKAALFLLDLAWHNLFEPWTSEFDRSADGLWFRCKACQRKVKRTGRESHFDWHKRELKGVPVTNV